MRLRRALINIIWILVAAILITLMLTHKEQINFFVHSTVKEVLQEKVIVPTESYNKRDFVFETVNETDNFEPHNIQDLRNIYYTVLNNGWENFTFYCPLDYKDCINDVLSIAKDKSVYLEINNYYVSPYNNYSLYNTTVSTSGEIYLSVDKLYSNEKIEYLKKYVDETLEALKIKTDNPTKEDLRKIHDFIINNVTYDDEYDKNDLNSDSNNAYGALVLHKAICSGYTDAYAIFLDRLNIKNIKLPSDNHIWNYLYFDGKWYHVDLTWDDDEKHINNTSNYFMINTEQLFKLDKEKHNFDTELFIETKE